MTRTLTERYALVMERATTRGYNRHRVHAYTDSVHCSQKQHPRPTSRSVRSNAANRLSSVNDRLLNKTKATCPAAHLRTRPPPTHASHCPAQHSLPLKRANRHQKDKRSSAHKSCAVHASAGNRTRGWPTFLCFGGSFRWQRPILPLNHQCLMKGARK